MIYPLEVCDGRDINGHAAQVFLAKSTAPSHVPRCL